MLSESKPWMDKLQVLKMVSSRNGSSARIFKAFADPPTTKLQRLKGLTTGGLPTFVDVGNSFGAPAIVEDNLMHQRVIEELESQSGPGGLHDNTMLIVMGDHGQTLNGDHGGGGSEEVETTVSAMNFRKPLSSIPPEFDSSTCRLDSVLVYPSLLASQRVIIMPVK